MTDQPIIEELLEELAERADRIQQLEDALNTSNNELEARIKALPRNARRRYAAQKRKAKS